MSPPQDPEKAIEYVEDRAFNDQRYYLETSKLSELGWKESVEWEAGIKETIEWYLTHGENWFDKDIRYATTKQRVTEHTLGTWCILSKALRKDIKSSNKCAAWLVRCRSQRRTQGTSTERRDSGR